MVLPTEAAFLACEDIDSIIALIYSGKLHVYTNDKKDVYICVTSLCSYPFEAEDKDVFLEDNGEIIEILTEAKTKNHSFMNEEITK